MFLVTTSDERTWKKAKRYYFLVNGVNSTKEKESGKILILIQSPTIGMIELNTIMTTNIFLVYMKNI